MRTRYAALAAALLFCLPLQAQTLTGGSEVGSFPNAAQLNGSERILADQNSNTVNLTPAQIGQYLGIPNGLVFPLGILLGGTGASTATGALTNLLPSFVSGDCLSNNGTTTLWTNCGASTLFQANATNLSNQNTINFENGAATGGLTLEFLNPSLGNVQLSLVGWPSLVSGDCLTNNGSTLSWAACGTVTWPSGSAGIPNYTGSSAWGMSYSASNPIPNNFLTPAGSSGQLQLNLSGAFFGFTLGGDCSLSEPNITCSTAGGIPIVTTTGTQTLTNKSISGSEINSGTIGATYLPAALSSSNSINGSAIPATAGTLNANGASWSMAAGFTGSYGSGHLNADQLLGDQLPSIATGFLQWTGSVWAFGTPTATPCGSSGNLQYNNSGTCGGLSVGSNTLVGNAGSGSAALTPAQAIQILNSGTPDNQIGTSYTFAIGDAYIPVTRANASTNTTCIPANSSVAFAVGTILTVQQTSTGLSTLAPAGASGCSGSGVTITSGGYGSSTSQTYSLGGEYGFIQIQQTATNTWNVIGWTPPLAQQLAALSINSEMQAYLAASTAATYSSCTPSASSNGPFTGKFTQPATPCTTITITMNGATGFTDSIGYSCIAGDQTQTNTGTNWIPTWINSADNSTTATLAIPAAAQTTGDVVSWSCRPRSL